MGRRPRATALGGEPADLLGLLGELLLAPGVFLLAPGDVAGKTEDPRLDRLVGVRPDRRKYNLNV